MTTAVAVPTGAPVPVPARPSVLVFSDVDETLIGRKSMVDFLHFHFAGRYGAHGALRSAAVADGLRERLAAGMSREEANRRFYQSWAGEPAAAVAASGERWFAQRSRDPGFFVPHTLAALRAHRAAGAVVALVSGSLPAVLGPIAAEVGAAHLLCATPEVRDGVLTGELVGGPVIAEGKRRCVRELLRRYPEVDQGDCFAYGDHGSDLPMLAEVGHPVIVGDDPALAAALPRALRLAIPRPGE
jgi:HAD superfamily hydrolase (TIGR01490 family)